MDFLNRVNNALLGPAGRPIPPAVETIQTITDRLTQSALLSDRRAAVLSLKSLTRDWKEAVGEYSLQAIIAVLQVDAKEDPEIGKATLETLTALCECEEQEPASKKSKDDLGLRHTDIVLSTPTPIHTILYLLTQSHFYVRFTSVQLLTVLVQNRLEQVQQHFLTDPDGPSSILEIISERREIIRNEALLLTQTIIRSNVDIQKSLAFGGIFEKLISLISTQGGVEGGIVAQDALLILDGLLQFNTSNQTYFRELGLPSALPQLLLYPSPPPAPDESSPQGFSLQFWDTQKTTNASIVVGMMAALSKGKGVGQKSLDQHGITRCLIDIALSSNAPTSVKIRALDALSPLADLSHQLVTMYIPVPESNGEEWDRLPEESALSALVGIALEGEYAGVMSTPEGARKEAEALQLRAVAATLFESHLYAYNAPQLSLLRDLANNNEQAILDETSPSLRIVRVLSEPPPGPISSVSALRHIFACSLLSSLVRSNEPCKRAAHAILPARLFATVPSAPSPPAHSASPANDSPAPAPVVPTPPAATIHKVPDDDDPPQSLLAHLVGSLALVSRARVIAREQGSVSEMTDWDRVLVAYLSLLSVWCWDYDDGVKEILEAGGALGLLAEPLAQGADVDILVRGISAFLLGVCYEFNRETGEVGRPTLHPIIHSQIGLDAFISALSRVRSDVRFKSISSNSPVIFFDVDGYEVPAASPEAQPTMWLDWPFVEFWKANSYAIQKAIGTDPNAIPSFRELDAETEAHIASYKDIIRSQAQELQQLHAQVNDLLEQAASPPPPAPAPAPTESASSPPDPAPQIAQLQKQIDELEADLAREQNSKREIEKEHEDLLVLLDELNSKRARDKSRMRDSGMDVSEGSDDGGDDEDADEDDGDGDDE